MLMDLLKKYGAEVGYYDPYIPVVRPTREHGHWTGTRSVSWTPEVLRSYDVVLISTNHKAVDYQQLAECADCIVDARNAMASIKTRPGQVWKA
jgi:UDP-N-acetyl-D-glucosamine dehydrogenase